MRIELAEVLACPRCRPEQGLVAIVEEGTEGRVREASLGCPGCGARHRVSGGHVRLAGGGGHADAPAAADGARSAPPAPGDGPGAGPGAEASVLVAALLGLAERPGGVVVLDETLAGEGPRLAALAEEVAVVALLGVGWGEEGLAAEAPPGLTLVTGYDGGRFPLRAGRFRGVALGCGAPARLEEGARLLGPGGRLAVLDPGPEGERAVGEAVEEAGLRIVAADARAVVAERAC